MNTWKNQVDAFKPHFNLLLVDLRDHGNSVPDDYTSEAHELEVLADDVIEVMDELGIDEAHFIGVSLGSFIIHSIESRHADRVSSIVLAGGIFDFSTTLNLLLVSGNFLSKILPFHLLYRLMANIILPKQNHKSSRRIFIREAARINPRAIKNWLPLAFRMRKDLGGLLEQTVKVPYLVVMGGEDHVFLEPALRFAEGKDKIELHVVEGCGHVVNLERPKEFNQLTLDFLLKE